ncbi:NAD(P)/FAD-dependent oxidoreductase [Cronbergia sp. UHCC 0137]|uniref:FAD-dependent oxidoreductase n=1 Tax=Cronbergia sp. UHCC 0137 TaxID=3110239 RepID=UPI002B207FC6|nr:NAD(P)/FAD-dependent oxidoreductase [Cronbergia sp. UHCC 0137]MEA5617594.1 NAD(P)/FAD-dependent oxidoreductase [Cronbergia sp. UHCC 0137]
MSEIDKIYDVVIIGAGPIGLATAIGLRQRGIENILVIDQTRAFRPVGQVLDILPNGLKALKCLDHQAYEVLKNICLTNSQQSNNGKPSPEWIYKNLQGEVIRLIPLGFDHWLENYGEGRVSIPWYELQTTLRNLIPPEQVKPNHRCVNLVDELENNYVKIDCVSDINVEANPYAYWGENQENLPPNTDSLSPQLTSKSFRAKLIVGADGINSTVRQLIYTSSPDIDFAKPEYSGFAGIFCMEVGEIPTALQTELEEKFLDRSGVLTITNDDIPKTSADEVESRLMLFRNRKGQLGYVIHLGVSMETLQDKTGDSLVNLAVQELEKSGFPSILTQLVRISSPANIQQRPYYIHHTTSNKIEPTWSKRRVVLVGDSAHGMPPFMAQGANQGLEDAITVVTLIANIAKHNNWDNLQVITEAFAKYQHLRRPFMSYIQKATLTRFPHYSEQQWQDYSQQVYSRNFDQIIDIL